ncbi:MAG: hypothetical protein WBM67_00550, partial [Sedimenticolaceae bacterium]
SARAVAERDLSEARQQMHAETSELQSQIVQLRTGNESLQAQLAEDASGSDEAVSQMRAEILELGHKLEEREQGLAAAREEQAELIEALNAASSELETLQLAVSDKDDEQARLVDLENQVAEALRTHEKELLAHEAEQRELRETLVQESERRHALQDELERVNALLEEGQDGGEEAMRADRDSLRSDLAARESEVEQLRSVIAEYVDQIREAQTDGDGGSDVAALRAELDMVRDQAIRDVAHMREQLASAETRKRRLQQADGREAISQEVMRQQIEALESSLAERQRELGEAEGSRHMLEDSLEDANRQLDEVRRELEKALLEADELVVSRREAETARGQLHEALCRLQEDAEEARVTDLRDARLKPSKRPIGMDSVAPTGRWLPGLIGAGIVLAVVEGLSIYAGNGELFTALLRLTGR